MVSAAGSISTMRSHDTAGSEGSGRELGSSPKREPMVSTGSCSQAASSEASTTAIRKPGARGAKRRRPKISSMLPAAMPVAQTFTEPKPPASALILGTNSAGRSCRPRPKKSLSWLLKMITAMPAVKPVISGCGMYFINVPTFISAAAIRISPAMIVASSRPSMPWCWITA